jgi:exosome complex component RRP4
MFVHDDDNDNDDNALQQQQKQQQQQQQQHHHSIVTPGQILAEYSSLSSNGDDSFISGHGTYIVEATTQQQGSATSTATATTTTTLQLRASICGTIQRINKLISVESIALYQYTPNIGDLIIGRVRCIQKDKWILDVVSQSSSSSGAATTTTITGTLPLSSVHLPGKTIQRKRNANDVLEMRQYITEGDLVSCEVHKVQQNSTQLQLHTRSVRYGKLENGCVIAVPCQLIPRRKTHYTTLLHHQYQILIGCNGLIWIQRNNNNNNNTSANNSHTTPAQQQQSTMDTTTTNDNNNSNNYSPPTTMNKIGHEELAQEEEIRRKVHAETAYTISDRQNLARIRNAIQVLRCTLSYITPESITVLYERSVLHPSTRTNVANMLLPELIVQLSQPVPLQQSS